MRPYTLKIAAGEKSAIDVPGDYVRVRAALVDLTIQTEAGDIVVMETGDSAVLQPFKRLYISHEDAAMQEIKLLIGTGGRADSSRVAGVVSIVEKKATTIIDSNVVTLTNFALLAPVLVVVANPLRRGLRFRNAPGLTGGVNTQVGLGGVGFGLGTASNAVILANVGAWGSIWNETECPTAAWYAKIVGQGAMDVALHIQEIF